MSGDDAYDVAAESVLEAVSIETWLAREVEPHERSVWRHVGVRLLAAMLADACSGRASWAA